MQGKLIIISAPSGSGKTSIIKEVLKHFGNIEFSRSATTRQPRKDEKHGEDYYFMTLQAFKRSIEQDEFLEYEQVYQKQYYGTLKSELTRIWKKGNHVIFDVDVNGGLNIKKKYPDQSLGLFIMPPSLEELKRRLEIRARDDDRSINQRLNKAKTELVYAHNFDKVIVNDNLEEAVSEAIMGIDQFLKKG